jgi:hypothetical protein
MSANKSISRRDLEKRLIIAESNIVKLTQLVYHTRLVAARMFYLIPTSNSFWAYVPSTSQSDRNGRSSDMLTSVVSLFPLQSLDAMYEHSFVLSQPVP